VSGAEDTSLSPAHRGGAGNAAAPAGAAPRRRLFRKYALLFIALVGAALLVNSTFDFWFSYEENKASLVRIQQEKAEAAARRIEEFIGEIERQIGWTTHAQWASGPLDQRRQDYFRLLRQEPPITELSELDGEGKEQLQVSRLKMDVVGSAADFSQTPAFMGAKAKHIWFSPVYFRKESEPYMTLAMAREGRNAGVTIAEINLKLIWDVITGLKIGKSGYAYVVDEHGRLIAHPDISLVLRDTDLSKLPQVAEALTPVSASGGPASRGDAAGATLAQNLGGHRVLTAHAAIQPVGWQVFVEVPLVEAFAPLYGAAMRTGALLLFGLIAATLIALVIARRMTGPIRAITEGAERIGAGEFERRIDIHTGDELEALAEQFNRMGADLQKSYAELEQRVADRTAELSESLDQQTATAEVLGVINSSPGDLAPVFDAMLEKALNLCDAIFGVLWTYDGERVHVAAHRGEFTWPDELLRRGLPTSAEAVDASGRLLRGEPIVHIADITQDIDYSSANEPRRLLLDAGARSLLAVPLWRDTVFLGYFAIYRREVRPFTDKQIALLQNFAAQAVIAMENARLITETREALEQQTATAEVLGVINSSPGDLAPVFDAMLERAMRLCDAAFGGLWMFGDRYVATALRGVPQGYADFLRGSTELPGPGTGAYRFLHGERSIIHNLDLGDEEPYRTGQPGRVALVDLGGARTALQVPLCKDETPLGLMTIYRQEVRPFTDKQIALLQNFAAQAVIAMENARLITETREALDQQTATSEVLQVINSSPGDLVPVFDAMLEKAMQLCGAAFGEMQTYDGERFQMAALRGLPPRYAEFRTSRTHVYGPGTIPARLLAGERPVHVLDITAEDAYRDGEPNRLALADLGGARTVLAVPLLKEGGVIGFIVAYRQEVRPFNDKQIALLQNFAAQAVIAMENARLLGELRARTDDLQESLEYQTATSDVLKVISESTFDLDPVLEYVVETAIRLCRAHMGSIFRLEDGLYRWSVGYGLTPAYREIEEQNPIAPGSGTLVGRVALEGRAVQIADVYADPLYAVKDEAQLGRARTMLGVPLLREGVPIGVIAMARDRVEPFNEKEIALVTTFADQAVIAIENARLLGELRSRTDDLARSVEELKALGEVGQEVSSSLDLRHVLVTILNRSVSLTGSDAGAIFRYSRAERAFHFVEAAGYSEAMVGEVRDLNVGETMTALGDAIAQRVPLQIPDLLLRPSNPLRDSGIAAGFRSVLIVPLVGADRIMGATILQRRAAGEFPEATVRLMQTMASQSVLAIQNARLFREIADKSEQLALASEHKSQFLANMSHELRTPLNAILGYTELMVDGIYGELPARAAGVLERVQNNGKHLLALINDVLDLAKIEAGQLTMQLDDYAMPDVVHSVVSATEALASTKGLKFTADIMAGLPPGRGDARRLAQVLLNLVGNAVKFTDEGEVAIGAMAENGHFVLTVRDTGPGIAPADQDRIFGEFQQIDNSNTRKKGGTGLGLAISKRMVEMQGGTISVESEVGQGSTFRVVLPVRVEGVGDELTGELMGAAQ
jgi:signal transduction histidine kinase/HAMP domain-containing protein